VSFDTTLRRHLTRLTEEAEARAEQRGREELARERQREPKPTAKPDFFGTARDAALPIKSLACSYELERFVGHVH
jgi:hypothetical protein